MGDRVPELDQDPVTHVPEYPALVARHGIDADLVELQHQLTHAFRTEPGGDRRGSVNVDEHHRHLPQLAASGAE
jgi:hypothetical protein